MIQTRQDEQILDSNSPLITVMGKQRITEGEWKELTCKVDSKQPAKIQWYHDTSLVLQETPAGNILNYTLSPVNRKHYGNYTCKASNGIGLEDEQNISITVNFKPLTATITGNINIIANGNNSLSLWCTSGSSYPNADIIWSANDVECNVMDKENLTHINGKYGGMKTQKELKRTPTRDNDGDVISCGAFNYLGRSEKDEVILDLRYNPLIKPMSDVIVVEGDTTELICEASSNPASTFKWYRQGQSGILKQWNGTLENNNLTYMINTVKRSDAATYRCNADNGIELADNATVLVTVHYPPVVKVIASNTTVGAISTILTCNAAGVPNSNYKYGKWIQTWPGYNIPVSERPGFINLVLNNLTYEHSGIYTCSVSNGIKLFGTTMEFMEGSVYLLVRSFPIIIHVQEKTPGKLGESVTVEVSYYSNVAGSTVKVSRNVNSIKRAVDFLKISETSIDVDLPVFRQIIKTAGTMARITIDIQSKEAFGYYDVVVSNDIGLSRTRPFEVVPKGPPIQPYGITVDNIEQKTARLSWICGFHGGFPQKIVIQLSSDQMQWRSFTNDCDTAETEQPMFYIFTNLNDSQTYHVRMYSFNIEGNSSFSEKHNFTTLPFSVSPQNPVISNTFRLPDTREVIDSNEGQPLTIQCTSRGGNPTPTVVWYSNSIASSNEMASTNTGSLLSDGTYIVTLEHTFTPNASDDRRTLICRTFYPEADSAHTGSKNKSIILYLKLKPRQPTVTQTSAVSAGDTVEIRCETSGCRPVANISWICQGSTVTSELSKTLDTVTETYTVVSLFKRQVTASDNGVNVQCVVTHPALISPSERTESINLNVTFGPSSSNISGNKEMVATGNTPLTLTCTTGSSNPASDITWTNGSALLTSNRTYTNSTEENNGVVRSQQLVLYPTRYMDGNNISCTVSNAVSLSDVVDTIVLNLNYSPFITITDQQQITVLEGESKELTCKVDSKPPATIQWYYDTSLVLQETPAGNILNYTLSQVNRTHYGNYTCKASNGIGLEDEQNISITVNFKPLTATITGNINIIANGMNSLSLWCTSGSSYPIADIIWSINDVECNVMEKGIRNSDTLSIFKSKSKEKFRATKVPSFHISGERFA